MGPNGQTCDIVSLVDGHQPGAPSVSEFPASASDAAKETFTALCDVSAGHRGDERQVRDIERLERVVRDITTGQQATWHWVLTGGNAHESWGPAQLPERDAYGGHTMF